MCFPGMAVILIPEVEGPEAISTGQVYSAVTAVNVSEKGDMDVSIDHCAWCGDKGRSCRTGTLTPEGRAGRSIVRRREIGGRTSWSK